MNRFAAKSAVEVLVLFIVFGISWPQGAAGYYQGAGGGQAANPCSFLTKSEAESILGESVVKRSDSDTSCWFVQEGFAGGTGPNSKQIDLSIWRSASPKADDVSSRRAEIA